MYLAKRSLGNTGYALRYYKKQIMAVLIGCLVVVMSAALCRPPSYTTADGLTRTMLNQIDNILSVGALQDVVELTAVFFDAGTGVLQMGGQTIRELTLLSNTSEFCTAVGTVLVALTFFVTMINSRRDQGTEEELIKRLLFLAAAIVLVYKAQDISYAVANFGTGITMKVAGIVEDNGVVDADLVAQTKQSLFDMVYVEGSEDHFLDNLQQQFASLGLLLELWIPSIAMWLVSVLVSVICWSRALEILILATFSPIAFADATNLDNFGHGTASRFIRNLMALSLSGAIIVFVMALCSGVMFGMVSEAAAAQDAGALVAKVKDMIVIGFAEAGLVKKAQSIAKTLCGLG